MSPESPLRTITVTERVALVDGPTCWKRNDEDLESLSSGRRIPGLPYLTVSHLAMYGVNAGYKRSEDLSTQSATEVQSLCSNRYKLTRESLDLPETLDDRAWPTRAKTCLKASDLGQLNDSIEVIESPSQLQYSDDWPFTQHDLTFSGGMISQRDIADGQGERGRSVLRKHSVQAGLFALNSHCNRCGAEKRSERGRASVDSDDFSISSKWESSDLESDHLSREGNQETFWRERPGNIDIDLTTESCFIGTRISDTNTSLKRTISASCPSSFRHRLRPHRRSRSDSVGRGQELKAPSALTPNASFSRSASSLDSSAYLRIAPWIAYEEVSRPSREGRKDKNATSTLRTGITRHASQPSLKRNCLDSGSAQSKVKRKGSFASIQAALQRPGRSTPAPRSQALIGADAASSQPLDVAGHVRVTGAERDLASSDKCFNSVRMASRTSKDASIGESPTVNRSRRGQRVNQEGVLSQLRMMGMLTEPVDHGVKAKSEQSRNIANAFKRLWR